MSLHPYPIGLLTGDWLLEVKKAEIGTEVPKGKVNKLTSSQIVVQGSREDASWTRQHLGHLFKCSYSGHAPPLTPQAITSVLSMLPSLTMDEILEYPFFYLNFQCLPWGGGATPLRNGMGGLEQAHGLSQVFVGVCPHPGEEEEARPKGLLAI